MLIIILFVALLFHELFWKRRNLPPGPTPLPLVGNVLEMVAYGGIYDALRAWTDSYGPVYTYWLGTMPVVTVNDWENIKSTFISDGDMGGDRKQFGTLSKVYRGGTFGIIDNHGHSWRVQRRFAQHTLREFGLGKAEMHKRVLEEAAFMLHLLEEKSRAGPFEVSSYLDRTFASVINLVLFGFRFDERNAHEFHHLRSLLNQQMSTFSNPLYMIMVSVAWLRHFPGFSHAWKVMTTLRDAAFDFYRHQFKVHRRDIDYDSADASDFCEAYLKEMRRQEKEQNTTFTEDQLKNVCLDLWMGGMETLSTTMNWAVLFMINHPDVQTKVHEELDRVIGLNRLVDMSDKADLPYVNACINEAQRCANIAPQNLLRIIDHDVTIAGHRVPAGTAVSPQISMLLHDPEVFPDPCRFDPCRFLDAEGKVRKYEQFMPFGVGKRQCVAEVLARLELYIFFANLLTRFKITAEDPANPPSLARMFTSGSKPLHYKCVLTPRPARMHG